MRRIKTTRRHLTFANVMSVIAVFIALGGASYAAVNLPKNSVGTKQLKKKSVGTKQLKGNAVNSNKVKDFSLRANDFKPGQIPSGPTGPTGLPGQDGQPGATGPQGAIGPTGLQGAPGPTEGTATPVVTATPNVRRLVGSFETKVAGRLLVTASVSRLNFSGCLVGSTFSAWLEVDDVPVPGSALPSLPLSIDLRGLTFTGVTAESVAAGQHDVRVAVACTSGPDSTNLSMDSGGVSVVALGG